MIRAALRAIAIAIAVASLIDPVFTLNRMHAQPLVLVDLSASGIAAIERELGDESTPIEIRKPTSDRIPCAPQEHCVIAADGSSSATIPGDIAPVSLIRLTRAAEPNISLQSVAIAAAHTAAAGAARIVVGGQGVAGRRTELRITDGTALVGSAVVEWKAEPTQAVDVAWWPIAAGPRLLRVEAVAGAGEAVIFDNAIDIAVNVASDRRPVLVFDARPSWNSTFVRRALEDDPRFVVEHRVRVAPSITAGTANARLDAGVLDRTAVLLVGAPDALTANDVALIDRFVRVRGGTAILLPEHVPSGAAAALFHGRWSEQLVAEPEVAGPLRATELLRPRDLGIAAVALAPVVIATPVGNGRIIVSGAMDAWRHRDADAGAFDRFWTTVVADGAALGERLRVEFDEPIRRPGSRAGFIVRYRSMEPPASSAASAVARCGERVQSLRLWPAGSSAVFRGELPVADATACTVEVAVNDIVAVSGIAIAQTPSLPVSDTLAALERAVHASGGVVTDEDNVRSVQPVSPKPQRGEGRPVEMHPMRAAWWLLPFAGCLSVEWWLRRRNGLH